MLTLTLRLMDLVILFFLMLMFLPMLHCLAFLLPPDLLVTDNPSYKIDGLKPIENIDIPPPGINTSI